MQSIKNDQDTTDVREAAYMLATVYHETLFSFNPVREAGKGNGRAYGNEVKVKDKNGNEHTNVYYGRGYVQLTWDHRYEFMSKKLNMGEELYIYPDKALEHGTAYKIMSYGMRNGSFTNRKFSDYISGSKCNYVKARQIINGLDRANKIAGYAENIEILLRLGAI